MSITTTKDVFCDTCGDWTNGDIETTNAKVRRLVKRDGWISKRICGRTVDICPKCQTKPERNK